MEQQEAMTTSKVWLSIIVALLVVAAYDTYLYKDGIPGNSITQVIRAEIKSSPLFSGGLGLFFGGLFMHFYDTTEQGK